MKHVVLFLTALILGTGSTLATTTENKVAPIYSYNYGNSFIFVENGITFSVYPNGELDFYIGRHFGANVNFGNTNITFNSGYDYDAYVQYDDYGAVIQV